jgi:hypothetical protein
MLGIVTGLASGVILKLTLPTPHLMAYLCSGGTAQLFEVIPLSKDQLRFIPSIRVIGNIPFKYFGTLPITSGQAAV